MSSKVDQLRSIAARPVDAVSRLANRPIGAAGRHRPFYPLNLLDHLRGVAPEDNVRGKVVLITGASSGIGNATAIRLGAAGATVLLLARNVDRLAETAKAVTDAGGIAHAYPCDLTDLDAIDVTVGQILHELGHVDILVNNAGRSIRRSVDLSYERFHDFERTMQLNYFAAIRLILRLLPSMREQKSGHIVNISSAGVQTRVPRFAGYIASKAALDTWSDAVQAETRTDGVHFTTIHMPLVRTTMISPTRLYDRFPALTPEQAANTIAEAIAYRPRRVGPAFGYVAAFADAFSPQLMDAVRSRGYHLFADSPAARGENRPEPEQTISTPAAAFVRATRGVHW